MIRAAQKVILVADSSKWILAGIGVTELSMSIPSVAAVKAKLRRNSHAQAKNLAQRALACATASEVHELVLA